MHLNKPLRQLYLETKKGQTKKDQSYDTLAFLATTHTNINALE